MSRRFPFSNLAFRTTRQTRATMLLDDKTSGSTILTSATDIAHQGASSPDIELVWPGGNAIFMLTVHTACTVLTSIKYQLYNQTDSAILCGNPGGAGDATWRHDFLVTGIDHPHVMFDVTTAPLARGVYNLRVKAWKGAAVGVVSTTNNYPLQLAVMPAD